MPRALIAGFCAVPGPDRAGVQLGHVLRALARHHTVDVLAVRQGDQAYVEKVGNARILRVPVPDGPVRQRIDAFRRALRRQIEGADYDVIQFRDGWSGIPVLEMRERLRYAAVFDAGRSPLAEAQVHDHETANELERDERSCAQRADLVLAATEPGRLYLESIVPPERVRLVPPGVDVDAFDWEAPAPGPPRILFAGALTPGRGARVLLRAMLDVATQTDARLAIAGRAAPEFFESLANAVRDLDLAGRVQLLGEVPHDQMPALIASATVCVAPGAVDLAAKPMALYPTKILEYMACQRPVVAPRRGSVTLLAREGQHVLLFEPGQPLDLARKLIALLGDAELRGRLARAGYELVRRAHAASGTRRELRRAYAYMASRPPWRDRFSRTLEEIPGGTLPSLGGAERTGGSGWVQTRAAPHGGQPIAAFEAADLDELTESNQVDTGVNDGLGDVTKVEAPPLGEEERAAVSEQPLSTSVSRAPLDEWVVDDSRIREADGERDLPRADVGERSAATPIDARFVAGELEVPTDGKPRLDPLAALDDPASFSAMGPLLGSPERQAEPARAGAREDKPTRERDGGGPSLPPKAPIGRL